jgi:hypothetical protein
MAVHLGKKGSKGIPSLLSAALALVSLTAVCFAAYWWGSRVCEKTARTEDGLMAEPLCLDFGEVWEDADFHWKLPIRNATAQEIVVLDFAASCTCVSLQPRSFSLVPDEVKELELSLDLTRRPRQPQDAGSFEALIVPRIKGAMPRVEGWTIHGKVRELLKLIPPLVTFGDLIRGQPAPDVLVKIESSVPLRKVGTKSKENNVCVDVVQKRPRNFELSVVPSDTLPSGPFRLEVPLQPIGETEQILPAKKLIVTGIMHDEVEPVPSPLVLGALPIGQTASETIALKSITGKPFKVEKVQSLSNGLRVELVERGDTKVPMVVVSQKSTTAGDQWTQAICRVRVGDQPSREIPLKIFYYGRDKGREAILNSEKH